MLRKRLVGVIAVEQGWAVQSFGYTRALPLGKPERLAENLDRWGADEIMVLDFGRSRRGLGPDMALIHRLSALGLTTPLAYGGGIRTASEGVAVIQAGAERLCVDSLLQDNVDEVTCLAEYVGAQALIAALPLMTTECGLQWYDHRRRVVRALNPLVIELLKRGYLSEALVIDWLHEGTPEGFNPALIDVFFEQAPHIPLLVYGGISETNQVQACLEHPAVSAVCIGNFLNYREHAIQSFKEALSPFVVRSPVYVSEYS